MMITEIRSGDDDEYYSSAVEATRSLVQNYAKEINITTNDDLDPVVPYFDPLHGSGNSHDDSNRSASCVAQHWMDTFHSKCISSHDVDNVEIYSTTVILPSCHGLVESYRRHMRNSCFRLWNEKNINQVRSTAHIVLIRYELMLKFILSLPKRYPSRKDIRFNTGTVRSRERCKLVEVVHDAIQCLAFDIMELTAVDKLRIMTTGSNRSGDDDHGSRGKKPTTQQMSIFRDMTLPTLLRILQHFVEVRTLLLVVPDGEPSSITPESPEDHDLKKVLTISALAALSFCSDCHFHEYNISTTEHSPTAVDMISSSFHISEMLPPKWLMKDLSLKYVTIETSAYSPNILRNDDNNNEKDDKLCYLDGLLKMAGSPHYDKDQTSSGDSFMDDPIVDLKNSCTSGTLPMPWICNVKGIGFRTARSLLRYIASLALTTVVDNDAEKRVRCKELSAVGIIIQAVGSECAVDMVRAHFFGRLERHDRDEDRHLYETVVSCVEFNGIAPSKVKQTADYHSNELMKPTQTSNRARLKWKQPSSPLQQKPYVELPARISSSLRFIAAMKLSDITSDVWVHSLTIIYTLIDSITVCHQALGSSLFLHMLEESTPASFVSASSSQSTLHQRSGDMYHDGYESIHNAAQILGMACRTCNDAVLLSILYKTQCNLFQLSPSLSSQNQQKLNKLKRDAVFDTLTWIQKNSYHGPGGDSNALECMCIVLVAGLQPLLGQLLLLPGAQIMEMGRLGLRTLLPLIRWDSKAERSRRIQCASITCLISLMMGSYPIMERHGGKIMSELLSCLGRAQKDLDIYEKLQDQHGRRGGDSADGGKDMKESYGTKQLLFIAAFAASIAHVLCGKRAEEILEKVENGNFDSSLIRWCGTVRNGSTAMISKEEVTKGLTQIK